MQEESLSCLGTFKLGIRLDAGWASLPMRLTIIRKFTKPFSREMLHLHKSRQLLWAMIIVNSLLNLCTGVLGGFHTYKSIPHTSITQSKKFNKSTLYYNMFHWHMGITEQRQRHCLIVPRCGPRLIETIQDFMACKPISHMIKASREETFIRKWFNIISEN